MINFDNVSDDDKSKEILISRNKMEIFSPKFIYDGYKLNV